MGATGLRNCVCVYVFSHAHVHAYVHMHSVYMCLEDTFCKRCIVYAEGEERWRIKDLLPKVYGLCPRLLPSPGDLQSICSIQWFPSDEKDVFQGLQGETETANRTKLYLDIFYIGTPKVNFNLSVWYSN